MDHAVILERTGGVLSITLNRPERKNALSIDMVTTIVEAVEGAGTDDACRAIVVQANGADFCTGMDLGGRNEFGGGEPRKPRAGHLQRGFQQTTNRMIAAMEAVQLPIVAGVRGWAAGIGNSLALSADVVVATPSAKFWVPFVAKGFTPDSGNSWILPRLVGLARAKEMVLRGKPISGEQAAAWGLISECVADDALEGAVAAVAKEFAEAATVSVGLAKTLLHHNLSVDLAAALQTEGVYEELAIRSDDFKEGMRAFAEKRPPEYTGW